MKKLSFFLIVLIAMTVFMSSFTTTNNDVNNNVNPPNEFEMLLNYLEANHNFINTDVQLIIPADEVKKNMKNPKYHLIDIRTESWFEYGHIKDAANVKPEDLPNYFETKINPIDYDKIVMICYSGQSAAYYAGLLRLSGYDNVYSMKWGMSSWRLDFAENSWLKNIADDYTDNLETTVNEKPEKGVTPSLSTGKLDAKEILKERLAIAFGTPYKEYILEAKDVFASPDIYYTINYWDLDKYTNGHVPGAIQYQPNGSLSSTTDLLSIPTDKKIAVYCATGQEAAYAVAYLNILGYDVGNIAYGSNRFMNKVLNKNNWDAFSKKEINIYPVVE